MRDPNRLDDLYIKICQLHKNNFPDMRIAQFISNFLIWCGEDIYYYEDNIIINKIEMFIRSLRGKK